jgi:hypothetical protein
MWRPFALVCIRAAESLCQTGWKPLADAFIPKPSVAQPALVLAAKKGQRLIDPTPTCNLKRLIISVGLNDCHFLACSWSVIVENKRIDGQSIVGKQQRVGSVEHGTYVTRNFESLNTTQIMSQNQNNCFLGVQDD